MKIGNCHSDEKVSQFWQQALAFLVDARLVDWSATVKTPCRRPKRSYTVRCAVAQLTKHKRFHRSFEFFRE